MVKSMLSGVAGLKAHQSKMDVIGNNIANVNTWGYKAQNANFRDSLYSTTTAGTGGNNANGVGGQNASQVGYGVEMSSISTNFSKSSPQSTENPLDVMIDGTGFFIVGSGVIGGKGNLNPGQLSAADLGGTGCYLSRVGILSVDNQGYLVDDQKNYIYGVGPGADGTLPDITDDPNNPTTLEPIKIPDEYVGQLSSYTIKSDGTVTGLTKETEVEVVIGKIALATVTNTNGLEKAGGYYYSIGGNAGNATAGQPNQVLGNLLSSYLEMPNVNLAKEFADMITTQRGYQANTKIITVTDEMLQELVNMKR